MYLTHFVWFGIRLIVTNGGGYLMSHIVFPTAVVLKFWSALDHRAT